MLTFHTVATVLGWAGTCMLLLAYWLVSNEKVHGESVSYQVLNIGGSIGLGVAAVSGGVWSAATLNTIWGAIGVGVLLKVWLGRRRRPSDDH